MISTWCAYFLVLRWVPRGSERGVSDPTVNWHPTAEFFLPSQFVLSSGELGVGRTLLRCTGRPGSQRNPAPAREVVDNRRHECGRVGSVGQASRRGSLRDGRGRCAPLDADGRVNSPCAKKVCPHSACTHPHRAHSAHTHDSARCTTRHVHCHMHVCDLWRCGLVSACE